MGELADRRDTTADRLTILNAGMMVAEGIATGKACVYATGSFGRGEASSHSDLDLFIVGKNRPDGQRGSILRPLDVAVAGAGGHTHLSVRRRPHVVVIPTGDEVRPLGSPKYAAGSAALCASPTNSALRQRASPGARVRRSVPRDRK